MIRYNQVSLTEGRKISRLKLGSDTPETRVIVNTIKVLIEFLSLVKQKSLCGSLRTNDHDFFCKLNSNRRQKYVCLVKKIQSLTVDILLTLLPDIN